MTDPRVPPARVRPAIAAPVTVALAGLVILAGLLAGCDRGGGDRPAPGPSGSVPASPRSSLSAGLVDLRGKIIVIDPGHNGGNSTHVAEIDQLVAAGGFTKACDTVGTTTDAGYPEHAFTFDVATRAATLLRARGATVILTRTNDTGVGPCVDERAAMANKAHADVAISVHADGGPAAGFGFHVIAPARAPDGANAAILAPSMRLADVLRARFATATLEPTADYIAEEGMAERSDLAGLNLSRVPKVFVECLNMRDAADAEHATDRAWRQRAAVGIANGLADYLLGAHG